MIHHRRKTDANQQSIIDALQKIGACVVDLSGAGRGVADLLVCFRGNTWLFEVKNLKGRGKTLTKAQRKLHAAIAEAGCYVHVVCDEMTAIELILRLDDMP